MTDVHPLIDSDAWARSSPLMSVLIPFLRDDPCDLLACLDGEAAALKGRVEIVLLDDGSADPTLTQSITSRVMGMQLPVRLITLATNVGRSIGRNRLAEQARGQSLLFLDSDMRPDLPDFLQVWLALVMDRNPAVAFGGFSLLQAPTDPRFAVHRAMAARSDCLDHHTRALDPEKHVYTSNLLVRRDVFDTEGFDPDFAGWGWEDVEWAMRVSRKHPVLHPDIPATHMGLDTPGALAAKYEQSAPNFARVLARHPDFVTAYPSYRIARILKRLPLLSRWRGGLKMAATLPVLPVAARAFSLRLYRTALYAEVV